MVEKSQEILNQPLEGALGKNLEVRLDSSAGVTEKSTEQKAAVVVAADDVPVIAPLPAVAPAVDAGAQAFLARQKKIEDVLASGLQTAYGDLPEGKRRDFKSLGEATAREINLLLSDSQLKINKIINLIKNWLMILPVVNRFFLEKEVKIKTDAIIQLARKGGEK